MAASIKGVVLLPVTLLNSARACVERQDVSALLTALEQRDPEPGTHLGDVTDLSEAVARKLKLNEKEVTPLLQAASLHDIGKAAIPDEILDKPSALDDAEWALIRCHTLIGERILGAASALRGVAKLVRSSHERFDGKGYPDGLEGEEIPLGARVLAVCDSYDAMTSDRAYRLGISRDAALAELHRCAGSQFDPMIVRAFCAAILEGPSSCPTLIDELEQALSKSSVSH